MKEFTDEQSAEAKRPIITQDEEAGISGSPKK